ncbi:Histidine-rich glycoprotein [Myotis brandtii]|uniref:Histidine-rich glycoprotein n=1 Tax=Myotis brandtii TaxID=109478 RepID=S7P5F8_MYOBR|nr:Histidine-rich glycoprotein [Myotis brandtii]
MHWITLRYSYTVSPIDCNATEPLARKALDLINKGCSNGLLFQLLRVAGAHLDRAVIGQWKVIATTHLSEFQDLRVNDFNCTTSSVFSALANTKDSPVLLDFFEETEVYRKQAEKVLEMYKKENGDFASFRVDQVERVGQGIRAPSRLPSSRCHHFHFGTNGTHAPPHNHSSNEHHSHGHHPHEHQPHGHQPHGHHPHGQHPDGHGFHDHGPCDPPLHRQGPQDHHHRGHSSPPRHSEERGQGKGHFPLKWRQIGYVYRLPPLKKGEVLPLPEANFPSFSLPNHNYPLKPENQPFPQSASELCPGIFNSEFSQVSKFFEETFPKRNLSSLKNE